MKKNIIPSILLTIAFAIVLCVLYPLLIRGIALLAPGKGEGRTTEYEGRKFYTYIGQIFDKDKYFWGRPSAIAYNATGSAGSNKGPTNKDYLKTVETRIDTFLVHNPGISRHEIPVDMVTASGSGLDPDISVQGAKVQIKRIARVRGIPEKKLQELVAKATEKTLFGPEKINVLKLNIALDKTTRIYGYDSAFLKFLLYIKRFSYFWGKNHCLLQIEFV